MLRSSKLGSPRKLEDLPAVEIGEVVEEKKILLLPPPTNYRSDPIELYEQEDYLNDADYWMHRQDYGHETALQLWYYKVKCG